MNPEPIMIDAHSVLSLISKDLTLSSIRDALDVMADAHRQGAAALIIHERQLHPDFFNLSTGLAGEILQKFSNYRMRLAIVGDFNKYPSENLHAFIWECNRGSQVCFAKNLEDAKRFLQKGF